MKKIIILLLLSFISKAQVVNWSVQLAGGDNAYHAANPTKVPLVRQVVLNTTTGQYKIGDGVTQLQNLPYYSGVLTGSYVPYTGATTSVNLGSNILTTSGTSSFGPVYIAAPSTSTGLYIETDNTGNQFPLVINAHGGTNAVAVLQGTNNSVMIWKNIPTNISWRAMNNVAATGAGLDSWGIGTSANPVSNYFSITNSTGYGEFRTGLNVGSLSAPTKTLSVTGDANITNSLTVSGTVIVGGTTAPTTTLGSAFTIYDGLGTWRIGKYNSTGRNGIWGHTLTPTTSNYNFVVDGDNVNAYVHGGSILNFVTNNSLKGAIGLTTTYFNQPTRIGSSTAPSATLDVTGTMSVSSTSSVNGLQLVSGGYSVTTKGIDVTAGDAATINSPIGRFRKDNSGAVFTLTNSQITANSIIVLTAANAAIDATATGWTISAGAGSATITFNAAPTSNFDMNFMIMN